MNSSKIKYHAKEIIKLADNSSGGTCKECPLYRMPDLSKLHPKINREFVKQLYGNYRTSTTWKAWADVYNHGTKVFKFTHEQMIEIGKALGFLEDSEGSEPPDPPPPPPPSKPKLIVKSGVLSYGSQKKFFGASLREAITNSESEGNGWEHPTLSNREVFDWYQGELAKHPFNLVRNNIGKDFKLLERHCEEMERQGKVHILTMADLDSDGMGDWREAFERTRRFKNILYNAYNEFTDRGLNLAVGITNYIQDKGGLVSCGAWTGQKGKELSKEYLKKCKPDVLSHHRTWDFSYMKELVDADWIVIWDEFFRCSPNTVESYMRKAEKAGVVGVNYYPFRQSFIGSANYRNYFEIAKDLTKEYNQ